MERSAELSEIQHFYKNKSLLITGVTGFLGKLVLEKILRTVQVKQVYVLIRDKNGVSAEDRCAQLFDSVAFGPLKRIDPEFYKNVSLIKGDLEKPDLGLNESDKRLIEENVECIIHCGAASKIDEPLLNATNVNVRGTKVLVDIAKNIPTLSSFVIVSTVYSNFPKYEIHEKFYETKTTAEQLLKLTENINKDDARNLEKELLDGWPSAYTFTLNVLEDYLRREAGGLPLSIVRPSLLLPTVEEPVTGYVDNVAGLYGDTVTYALGVNRVNYYNSGVLDAVPVDYVVNLIIASGWYAGLQKIRAKRGDVNNTEAAIYHCISSQEKSITIDEFMGVVHTVVTENPSSKMIQLPTQFKTSCYYNYKFLTFLLHTCMAFLCDTGLNIAGRTPSIMKMYEKVHRTQELFSPYLLKQWYFSNDNTQKLLKRMSFRDRDLYKFDILDLNWQTYFISYVKGVRVYLLKDPMSTLTEARHRQSRLLRKQLIWSAVAAVFVYVVAKILLFRVLFR